MKKIFTATIILAVAVLTGCNREERFGKTDGTAKISLSLSSEGEFTQLPATKAETSEDDVKVDVNEFSLVIKSQEGSEVESWSRFADVPAVIGLDPGTYTIEAKSPGQKTVDWTQPKYAGSQEVTVTPGNTESVAIVCKLTNMKVTVRTTEKFDSEIEDFTVTVTADDYSGIMAFTKAIVTEGRSAYFDPTSLTVDINATRKAKEGVEIENMNIIQTMSIPSGAAQDHHVITLDASETGYTDLSGDDVIKVVYTLNNKEVPILVDGLEENPVEDEPGTVPALSSSSVADGSVDVPVATASIDLTYSTAVALADGASITLGDQTCGASVSGNTLTVTLPTLAESTQYTLTVPEGAVVSVSDASLAAEAVSISFTTAAAESEEPDITITATAGIDEPVTYSKAALPSEFNLTVEAPAGIEKFVVDVNTPGLQELLDLMKMDYSVDLANMNDAELEFWGNLFGITSNADVNGQTSKIFEIAAFLTAMPEEKNELKVTITDKAGNSLSKTLTIIMTE